MKKQLNILTISVLLLFCCASAKAAVYTWTGTASTDWATMGNWSPAGVPGAGDTAILQASANDPVLNTPATVSAVELPNAVTLQLNAQLTVTGYMDVAAGGTLNIAAGSPLVMGDGSVFFDEGTVNGPITYEKTVPFNGSIGNVNGLGYRYFSSPVQGATVNGFSDDLGLVLTNPYSPQNGGAGRATTPFPNFFFYDEALLSTASIPGEDAWETPTATSNPLTPGTGCIVNVAPGTTMDLTGAPTSGNVSVQVRNTAGGSSSGYNLVGNPYPAPIDWDLVYASNSTDVGTTIWLRNATSQYGGTFVTYNEAGGITIPAASSNDGKIMPMQGFFVERPTVGTANLDFQNSHRLSRMPSTGNTFFYKNDPHGKTVYAHLQLTTPNGHRDETAIYAKRGATDGYEAGFDSRQFQYNSLPQPTIFSKIGSLSMKINGLESPDSAISVPLGMYLPEDGNYTLKPLFLESDLQAKGMDFYLEDKALGTTTQIYKDSLYSFTAKTGDHDNRFVLHLMPQAVTSLNDAAANGLKASLWPNPNGGEFRLDLEGAWTGKAQLTVHDLTGKTLINKDLEKTEAMLRTEFATGLGQGVYLLRILAGGQTLTQRLVIR